MMRSRSAEAGFTLLELAVATLVLMVAIFIASEMLDQSGRILQHSVRRAQDPYTLLARELLRNDIRGASAPSACVDEAGWPQHGPLELRNPLGVAVWSLDGGSLLRSEAGGAARAYLAGVRRFTWKCYRGSLGYLVEVDVRYHTSGLYLHQAAGSLPRSDPGEDHTLYVAMVARLGARAW
jgi:hypothetical protein